MGNIYKQDETKLIMAKKEVSVSLDESVLTVIDCLCKEHFGAKRPAVINNILRNNLEIKKRLKKK